MSAVSPQKEKLFSNCVPSRQATAIDRDVVPLQPGVVVLTVLALSLLA